MLLKKHNFFIVVAFWDFSLCLLHFTNTTVTIFIVIPFNSVIRFFFFILIVIKNPFDFYLLVLFLTAFYRSSFMYYLHFKQLLLDYVRNDLRTCCKLKLFTENRKFQFSRCACFRNLRSKKKELGWTSFFFAVIESKREKMRERERKRHIPHTHTLTSYYAISIFIFILGYEVKIFYSIDVRCLFIDITKNHTLFS